jgi:serine/threonine-protein kinase RsbW
MEQAALAGHEIELRMLAVREHVPGLRALAAEQAMRADHDLDFIDDVRLAVDEACAIVLAKCSPTDLLTVRLLVDSGRMQIDAWAPLRSEQEVRGLSLRVLQALADSLEFSVDGTADQPIFRLYFSRSRPATRDTSA